MVPPKFLDLCSFVIAHKFSSPTWLNHLKVHISVENAEWLSKVRERHTSPWTSLKHRIKVITLRPGEAMVFAPAALIFRQVPQNEMFGTTHTEPVVPLGQGYLKVKSRARITTDGGRSVLATASISGYTPNQSSSPSLSSMIKNDDDREQTHVVGDLDVSFAQD